MTSVRTHENGSAENKHAQANGVTHKKPKQKKVHPLFQLLKHAGQYAKEHPLMALSIALAIGSEAYFQVYTEDQSEEGIDKSNTIIAKAVHSHALDLSDTLPKIFAKSIAGFTTGCNIANDFLFLRPQEFIEGYEKAFPDGFLSGLNSKRKFTFSSTTNFFKMMAPLLSNLGAFTTLTYADVMTLDNPAKKGGNNAGTWIMMLLIMYGGIFNYFMTQGADTHEGLEFTFSNEDKSYKPLWSYWHLEGMRPTIIETELVRSSQNLIRGVLGGFLAKYFLENRGFIGDSYTMKTIPPIFGLLTSMQSFLARNPTGYKRNIGPLNVGKNKAGVDLIYRFDNIEFKALQDQYLKDIQDTSCRFWKKYKRLKNPVCLAQTGLSIYIPYRVTQFFLTLLPESMNGVGTNYVAPGILGLAIGILSLNTFYKADMRKELSQHILEDLIGKPEKTSSSDLAELLSKIIVVGAFTARTINGVPAMISFGEYLPFLSDLDKTVLAYTLGTLVNVAGYEYYYPAVCKSTQAFINFIKECFASPCCKPSSNANTLFGKNKYPGIKNSDFSINGSQPLLSDHSGENFDPEEPIEYSVSSVREEDKEGSVTISIGGQ